MSKDLIKKTQKVGTVYVHTLDFTNRVEGLGATIASASWVILSGTSATFSLANYNAVKCQAALSIVSTGRTHFRVTVTYEDTEVSIIDYLVTGFAIG